MERDGESVSGCLAAFTAVHVWGVVNLGGKSLGSENRQWGPVVRLGSKPCLGGPGPEIHQKIDNFKSYHIC